MLSLNIAPLTLVAFGAQVALASTRWPQTPDSYDPITTYQRCPYNGQLFPPPTDAGNAPAILAAQSALRAQLDSLTQSGDGVVALNSTFFSVAVFSAADTEDGPFFDYHFSVPGMENATGGRELDNESLYRIGSVTKMLTVYALLAARGDRDFGRPITEFLPDLEQGADEEDELARIQWEDITVEALASQISGIPRDCEYCYLLVKRRRGGRMEVLAIRWNERLIRKQMLGPTTLLQQTVVCCQFWGSTARNCPLTTFRNAAFRLPGSLQTCHYAIVSVSYVLLVINPQ